MALKRYSNREPMILIWVMLPYVVILNTIAFGSCIFSSLKEFTISFLITTVYIFAVYAVFGMVAVLIKKRFPANSDLFRRIGAMLPVFYAMNVLMLAGFYALHNWFQPLSCQIREQTYWWAIVFACIASTVITFLNEAVANWQSWKISITENEQLKNSYQKTRLLGLKGQVNPHFLFNCFNSLSSLINDNEEEAEKFLDEMTKVHRYMLRSDDEQLVSVDEELRFVHSYLYLVKARFGDTIRSTIEVKELDRIKQLPPLSLQVILENIIYTNAATKEEPLLISISSGANDVLVIKNSLNPRMRKDNSEYEEGLDNLVNKYKLLNQPAVAITETQVEREICLPYIEKEEVLV
jgi:two-component system, LytTR family, sensor kinase